MCVLTFQISRCDCDVCSDLPKAQRFVCKVCSFIQRQLQKHSFLSRSPWFELLRVSSISYSFIFILSASCWETLTLISHPFVEGVGHGFV